MAISFCTTENIKQRETHWADYFPEKINDEQKTIELQKLIEQKSQWLVEYFNCRYNITEFNVETNFNAWLNEAVIILVIFTMQMKKSKLTDEMIDEMKELSDEMLMIIQRKKQMPNASKYLIISDDRFSTENPVDVDEGDYI